MQQQNCFAAPALATRTPSQVLTDILTPSRSRSGILVGKGVDLFFLLENICEEMMFLLKICCFLDFWKWNLGWILFDHHEDA